MIPELGIAVGAVGITAILHVVIVLRLGENPLFLFAATAAALTFWRGLGPGMLASSLGSAIGSSLYATPLGEAARRPANIPIETVLLFAGSMFTCWLIYRLRVDKEDAQSVQDRRNDALAFVSHELRQPLSNITLAAEILERDPSEETRRHVAKLILRSAIRLGSVIDDLADVTRMQADAMKIDTTGMRLQDAILAAVDAERPAIEQKQQRLIVNVPLDPPFWIKGDPTRLEQVFGNLLSNARKYSPEGAEISVTCAVPDDQAVVTVHDSGVGINRDMLEAIFDPFVRESGGAEGLGIGLTLVRDLVKRHGGRIRAHSDGPGRGSTFTIELPVLTPQLSVQPAGV